MPVREPAAQHMLLYSLTHTSQHIGETCTFNVYFCAFGYICIYIYAFSRRFYPKRLKLHSGYRFFVSMCVPWESNPQTFALLSFFLYMHYCNAVFFGNTISTVFLKYHNVLNIIVYEFGNYNL